MIKIKNIAFEQICERFNVQRIDELSDEQMKQVCKEIGVVPVASSQRRNGITATVFVRGKTQNLLKTMLTFSDYISMDRWTDDVVETMAKENFQMDMLKDESGRDTMRRYKDYSLGFYELEPGQTQELNTDMTWVEEYLVEKPYARFLEIEADGETFTVTREVNKLIKSRTKRMRTGEEIEVKYEDIEVKQTKVKKIPKTTQNNNTKK